MLQFNQEADRTSEAAKALVCPLREDVEQLQRDVSEIREILKQDKRHDLREVNEVRPPSQRYTGAFIVSHNNTCFTYAGMFCDSSSKSKQILR